MNLGNYLQRERLSNAKFAEIIRVSGKMTIYRYRNGAVPGPTNMQKIIDATNGEVTANDWFVIPAPEGVSAAEGDRRQSHSKTERKTA